MRLMPARSPSAAPFAASASWDLYCQVDAEITKLGSHTGTYEEAIDKAKALAVLPHLICCVFIMRAGQQPPAPHPKYANPVGMQPVAKVPMGW